MAESFDWLSIHPEIQSALMQNQPVVALESTLIAQGMPYPTNIETANNSEAVVRAAGAIPATIAVLKGVIKVGLTRNELEKIGNPRTEVMKCSTRDLPYAIAKKKNGATTVAATMRIAKLSGIPVFATGGIGGVHSGAMETLDISADLQELSRTNVAVISAGAKSILDLGLTLEYLETMSVPVIGYRTIEFPAFYLRNSGFGISQSFDSVTEIAKYLKIKRELTPQTGVLIANSIPEKYEIDSMLIQESIRKAIGDANRESITGKSLTPFLLDRVEKHTGGASLACNQQLVWSNAKLAAEIAVEYSRIKS